MNDLTVDSEGVYVLSLEVDDLLLRLVTVAFSVEVSNFLLSSQ